MSTRKRNGRAVIVGGLRTPFVRAFAELLALDAIDLGCRVVDGLLQRTAVPPGAVDAVFWGGVILPTASPNVGREIALELGMHRADAFTVSRACASSLLAATQAAAAVERGEHGLVVAGGGDSTSNAEVPLPTKLIRTVAPVAMNRKAGPADWLTALARLAPFTDLLPRKPRVAERSTGQLMGEAAEEMARRNGIGRQEQDAFALRSHRRAAAAMASGRLSEEIVPVATPGGRTVSADTIVRGDTSPQRLARLRPAFARDGSVTAGNSSALTDGAAALLIASERRAEELGLTPLATFRSWHYVGVDPADQLLVGPAISMPAALDRAGLALDQVDLVDMHEAFAAQVLSVLKLLASEPFARRRLGRKQAVGQVKADRLNIHGGSIALGHPFAATGGRMVLTMANELHPTGKKTALLGLCAAGGLGAAAVLERC